MLAATAAVKLPTELYLAILHLGPPAAFCCAALLASRSVKPCTGPLDNCEPADSRYTPHEHYSDRAPWLRAAVLGANDGLVSVGAILLGVGAGNTDLHTLVLSGLSALVAGAHAPGSNHA